jgi:hypothetical protein
LRAYCAYAIFRVHETFSTLLVLWAPAAEGESQRPAPALLSQAAAL